MHMQHRSPSRNDWFSIFTLGLIWGASFMAVAIALRGFGPLWVAAGRISLGALTLYAILRLRGGHLPRLADANGARIWVHAVAMGLFSNALPFALLSWGQERVTSGFAGVSMAVVPLFVLPLAHLFVPGERLNWFKSVGFVLGFAGIVVLVGSGAFTSAGGNMEAIARLAVLAATLCYALGTIVTRRCPPVSLVSLATAALLVATLTIVPVALMFEGVPRNLSPGPVLALLYLGLIPTALATLLLVRVIRSAGPSFMVLTNYQVPVWAVIFGWSLLGEPLPPQLLIALGLILVGVAISQRRPRTA